MSEYTPPTYAWDTDFSDLDADPIINERKWRCAILSASVFEMFVDAARERVRAVPSFDWNKFKVCPTSGPFVDLYDDYGGGWEFPDESWIPPHVAWEDKCFNAWKALQSLVNELAASFVKHLDADGEPVDFETTKTINSWRARNDKCDTYVPDLLEENAISTPVYSGGWTATTGIAPAGWPRDVTYYRRYGKKDQYFPKIFRRRLPREIHSLADPGSLNEVARFVATLDADRGFSASKWRHNGSIWEVIESRDYVDSYLANGIVERRGLIEPGDIPGWWILNDLRDAINLLVWTYAPRGLGFQSGNTIANLASLPAEDVHRGYDYMRMFPRGPANSVVGAQGWFDVPIWHAPSRFTHLSPLHTHTEFMDTADGTDPCATRYEYTLNSPETIFGEYPNFAAGANDDGIWGLNPDLDGVNREIDVYDVARHNAYSVGAAPFIIAFSWHQTFIEGHIPTDFPFAWPNAPVYHSFTLLRTASADDAGDIVGGYTNPDIEFRRLDVDMSGGTGVAKVCIVRWNVDGGFTYVGDPNFIEDPTPCPTICKRVYQQSYDSGIPDWTGDPAQVSAELVLPEECADLGWLLVSSTDGVCVYERVRCLESTEEDCEGEDEDPPEPMTGTPSVAKFTYRQTWDGTAETPAWGEKTATVTCVESAGTSDTDWRQLSSDGGICEYEWINYVECGCVDGEIASVDPDEPPARTEEPEDCTECACPNSKTVTVAGNTNYPVMNVSGQEISRESGCGQDSLYIYDTVSLTMTITYNGSTRWQVDAIDGGAGVGSLTTWLAPTTGGTCPPSGEYTTGDPADGVATIP